MDKGRHRKKEFFFVEVPNGGKETDSHQHTSVSSHILILFLLSSEAFKISKEQKKFYRDDVHNYTDISYN